MDILCPLNKSSKVYLIETIKIQNLIKIYNKFLGSDISQEFGDIEEIGFYHCIESDLKFFHPMITGSSLFYGKFQKFDWYYPQDKDEYNYVSKFIKESDFVLDIGCGEGFFSKKIPTKNYVGLELSQKAKESASENHTFVLNESIQNHANANPNKYDVVCGFHVIEHVAEVYSFIESSLRCLKPGGLLIYALPSTDSCFSAFKNNFLNMPPHHVSWWSDKSLNYISKMFDLKIVDIKHDDLSGYYKEWYISSILIEKITKLFRIESKNSLLDISLRYKVMSKIGLLVSKLLGKRLINPQKLPNGPAVIVVYQKLKS